MKKDNKIIVGFVMLALIIGLFFTGGLQSIISLPSGNIADFNGDLDGFVIGCGGPVNSSYINGVDGQGIEIWQEPTGNGLVCLYKDISYIQGSNITGFEVYFYGKGYVKAGMWTGLPDRYISYLEEVETGERTIDGSIEAYTHLNNGSAYEDWTLFKLVNYKSSNSTAKVYLYNGGGGGVRIGQNYSASYDSVSTTLEDIFVADCDVNNECSLNEKCYEGVCVPLECPIGYEATNHTCILIPVLGEAVDIIEEEPITPIQTIEPIQQEDDTIFGLDMLSFAMVLLIVITGVLFIYLYTSTGTKKRKRR